MATLPVSSVGDTGQFGSNVAVVWSSSANLIG
uniref:Uncharacterized protein n=1 Tax=Anguilla anguilla TaxID=7936 RepID=A0A0E9SJB7_ANGAN